MEQKDIAALLEALCERPLADGQAEPSAELQVFCREAAKALSQAGDAPAGAGPVAGADADRLTAALASLLSGSDAETARRTVEEAVLSSAAARLDAEAALAFVDAIEGAPQAAPAHLVEEIVAADRAAAAGAAPRQGVGMSGLLSVIAGGSWSARRWRMAAACTVLLAAGVATWSVYWQGVNPADVGRAPPMAKTTSEQPAVADAPAPPRPALATTQACEPRSPTGEAAKAENSEPADAAKPVDSSAGAACASEHQFADRPADELQAMAARQRAEAARQAAAAAQAAAEAAGKVGAAQAGRESDHGPVQADRSGPVFGAPGHTPPAAAARTAPAAAPATRPAAPFGGR